MSQGTRKKELSLLNLLFCILVVLIHCLSQPVSVLDRSSWQYALFCACSAWPLCRSPASSSSAV